MVRGFCCCCCMNSWVNIDAIYIYYCQEWVWGGIKFRFRHMTFKKFISYLSDDVISSWIWSPGQIQVL